MARSCFFLSATLFILLLQTIYLGFFMKKKLGLISLFLIIAVTTVYYFQKQKHNEHITESVKYSGFKPWRQSFDTQDEYVAQIKSIQHIDIRSFEKGFIDKIFIKEGQNVTKGQALFQLMPKLLEAEFQKKKAEYDLAHIEYKNTKSLHDNNVVSANELALAKARLDKVQADLNLSKTHLDFTTIKAPFNGIIDRFRVRLGSLVEKGNLLTTLSDNSKMWVYFNVSETTYLDLMSKKINFHKIPVTLRQANGKNFPTQGFIDTIEADFNNKTGNLAFRATFDNQDGVLRHGETGTILLTQKFDNALVIPQKATFEILDKVFVYMIDADGTLRSQQIVIDKEIPHLFAIQSGLKESDVILLEGFGKVHSGEKISFDIKNVDAIQKSLRFCGH
jgi:membrane fusion protein, multidrug efflux system